TLGLAQSRTAHADFDGTSVNPSTVMAGVYASPNGVVRPALIPSDRVGVRGVADAGAPTFSPLAGVQGMGNSADGVVGISNTGVGVKGFSNAIGGTNYGIYGNSFGHGIGGSTDASPGSLISGFRAAGVFGTGTTKNVGVYGYDTWPAAPTVLPSFGTVGHSTSAYGVFGYSAAPARPAV